MDSYFDLPVQWNHVKYKNRHIPAKFLYGVVIILGLKFDTELAEMWLNAEFSNFLNKIAAQERIPKKFDNLPKIRLIHPILA